MNNLPNHDDRIQAYISGNLSKIDRLEFEDELNRNAAFKRHFMAYIEAQEISTYNAYRNLKQKFEVPKNTSIPHSADIKKRQITSWVWLLLGIILISLLALFWNKRQQNTPKQLFAEYYSAPPIGTTRSIEYIENPVEKGIRHFEKGDLDSVMQILDRIPTNNEEYNYGLFIRSIALIEHKEYGKSIKYLEELSGKGDPRFQEMSEWYLSLAYIRSDKYEESINLLSEIAGIQNHNFSSEAKELVIKLRKN